MACPLGESCFLAKEKVVTLCMLPEKAGMSLHWIRAPRDKKKAMNLAREKGVEIRYDIGDLANIDYPESSFDVVSLIFVHLPPEIRQACMPS